jgi:hypothetical protein
MRAHIIRPFSELSAPAPERQMKVIWVWLLWNDAEMKSFHALSWFRGLGNARLKAGYDNISRFRFAASASNHVLARSSRTNEGIRGGIVRVATWSYLNTSLPGNVLRQSVGSGTQIGSCSGDAGGETDRQAWKGVGEAEQASPVSVPATEWSTYAFLAGDRSESIQRKILVPDRRSKVATPK